MSNWLIAQTNYKNHKSLGYRFRTKRKELFEKFYESNFDEKRVKVLDAGGTYYYWTSLGFKYLDSVEILLLNLSVSELPAEAYRFKSVAGDATNMKEYNDKEFDLCFSNSVIEHVGGIIEQHKMADEIQRVGKHYFIQTPNKYFFMEPHFLVPFFQFFPPKIKIWLVRHKKLGHMPKGNTYEEAKKIATEVRLLSYKELKKLFPRATIRREKILCFTKSFILFE